MIQNEVILVVTSRISKMDMPIQNGGMVYDFGWSEMKWNETKCNIFCVKNDIENL
jgi:hypothetical protein